jgi:beta-glucosidase
MVSSEDPYLFAPTLPPSLPLTRPVQPGIGDKSDLLDEVASVSADIANTGSVNGHEVAQLYVAFPDEADRPVRQLRAFERLLVASGASRNITFSLRRRDLSYWNVVAPGLGDCEGAYTFNIGASSRDLRLNVTITI